MAQIHNGWNDQDTHYLKGGICGPLSYGDMKYGSVNVCVTKVFPYRVLMTGSKD